MKNIAIILLFCFFKCWSLQGMETPFYNNKEANSSYFDDSGLEKLYLLKAFMESQSIQNTQLIQLFDNCFNRKFDKNTVCEIRLLSQIKEQARSIHIKLSTTYLKHLLLFARLNNYVDDVSLFCLLNAFEVLESKTKGQRLSNLEYEVLLKKYPTTIQNKVIKMLKSFLSDPNPIIKTWPTVVGQLIILLGISEEKQAPLNDLVNIAYYRGAFSKKEFELLQQLIAKKASKLSYTLSVYLHQKRFLPLQQVNRTLLTTKIKSRKTGRSHRQSFYLKYGDEKFFPFQIKALGQLLEQFQKIVFESKVEITITNNSEEQIQSIALSSMEQYNFAVRQLRKSIIELEGKYYFYNSHKKIDFMDIIVAGQELNLLPTEVLNEMAQIELLWNPKQPKGAKLKALVKFIAPVSGLLLTGPVSFIPSIGILIIESFTQKEKVNEKVHNLF